MSVLPSFKSTFPSFAEAEAVRVADDSTFAFSHENSSAVNSTSRRRPPSQDHLPTRLPNTWAPLHTATATTANPASESPQPQVVTRTEATIATDFQSNRSRPSVAPLPLDQLSSESFAPLAFGFDARSKNAHTQAPQTSLTSRSLEPLPLEILEYGSAQVYGLRTTSFKRANSSSIHVGPYKRPRSHSVSAGGAFLKPISSSGSTPKILSSSCTVRNRTESAVTSNTGPPGPSTSSGLLASTPGSSRRDSVKVSGLLSNPADDHRDKSYISPTADGAANTMSASGSPEFSDVQSHRWSRVVSSDRSTGKSGGANGNANSSFPGRSQNVAHQLIHVQNRSNSSAIGGSGIGIGATNTNFPLVASSKGSNVASFGTPSISNRSPSSKLLWSECAPRLTSEDNIIEESTIPSAIDVLSSPRQRSLNSSLTGRTGATRGAIGPALPLHGGPTASDVSVLMRRTQHGFGERDQKGAVAEEGSLGPSELQRPMIGATESTAGIERDQTRDVSEDNGERINVSSIVKARLPGKFVGKAQEALRCKNGMIRQHYVGRIGEGQGARQQLWGGYGVSSDRNMWKKGGERDRDENWNHERNSAVCKVEGHLVPKEAKSKERLWGGHVSGREDIGLKASGTEKLGKTQLWKGEDKEHEREEQGAWKRTGEQHTGNKWRREGVEGGARKGGDEGENVQCPHCERRLRNAVTLQNHVRVVHDHSGNFLCSQCPAAFMWRSTLGNHVRLVHEKQRPYDCKECHKAFRWRSHLREHIWVVHKNEKPFRCETCGKTFGRKNNMQKHMRKHLQQNGQQ